MENRRFFFLSALGGLLIAVLVSVGFPGVKSWFSNALTSSPLLSVNAGFPRQDSYNSGIQRAAPAVVSVYSSEIIYRNTQSSTVNSPNSTVETGNTIAPLERHKTNQGSGVIISEDGYVLTNNHLITGADDINVALADGRLFQARTIGADPETDLAVIKIDSPEVLPHCNPVDGKSLLVGDIVLAIGNPFGVGQTVTQGIVSATSRHITGTSRLQNFVQIDAAINPGNSGGALINPQGELVGINTGVFSPSNGAQGIGFAIPAELIQVVVPEIIEHGRVIRGWLGVVAENLQLHPDLYRIRREGAVISGVFNGSPAGRAGLRRLDIITALDDEAITSSTEMMKMISWRKPGSIVTISGIRQQKPFEIELELTERPIFENSVN